MRGSFINCKTCGMRAVFNRFFVGGECLAIRKWSIFWPQPQHCLFKCTVGHPLHICSILPRATQKILCLHQRCPGYSTAICESPTTDRAAAKTRSLFSYSDLQGLDLSAMAEHVRSWLQVRSRSVTELRLGRQASHRYSSLESGNTVLLADSVVLRGECKHPSS